ncbi:hypothetical protein OG474_03820 [Kribbella sp. NBC_01505]|uniref:sigma factor-like helix-turn-helix DNA-binding protein n=1 Tax=Kribbella sp. NBC_01505 TaxID=2903580 RepID=UPI00386D551F
MNRTIEFPAGARTSATAEEFADFVDGRFTALRQFGYLLTGDWQLAERLAHAVLTKVWFRRSALKSEALDSYTLAAMVTAGTRWWRRTPRAPKTPQPALLQALATLPRRTRAIVVLRYLEDLPDAEIAQIMRCSVDAVQARLSRGVVVLESS